jgi:hypothetical protein
MGPLRGRDAAGRIVREPRRGPPQVGRDPRRGAASVTRHECQRVGLGGGRGGGRRRGLHDSMALPWLSQATRTVDLRSPLVRPPIAVAGDPPAVRRRRWTRRPNSSPTPRRKLSNPRSPLSFSCMDRSADCSGSPLSDHSLRKSRRPTARTPSFAYRKTFVDCFVGVSGLAGFLAARGAEPSSVPNKNIR